MKTLKWIFYFIFFGFSSLVYSLDCQIQGKVLDEEGEIVLNANVLLLSKQDSAIVHFVFSDEWGQFSFVVDSSEISTLYLQVSMLGTSTVLVSELSCGENYAIALNPAAINIKEVTIESKAIEEEGDTLTYHVSSFRQERDLVLADVLSHMPGIEISDNGQIRYQGEAINKFYIEGSDLLGSKYGVANKNLRVEDIASVQVLKNHQPKKVLKDVVFSDKAALNIKLKSNFTAAFPFSLTAGLPLFQREVKLTPMVFNKTIQTLNTLTTNNLGTSLQYLNEDLYDFFNNENNISIATENRPLGIVRLFPPPIHPSQWVNNHSYGLGTNALYRKNKEEELKINANYTTEELLQDGNRQIIFNRIKDTIASSEILAVKQKAKTIYSGLAYIKNSDKVYIHNHSNFKLKSNNDFSDVAGPPNYSNQLERSTAQIDNSFLAIIKANKNIYRFELDANFLKNQEELIIDGDSQDQDQYLEHSRFELNPWFSFTKSWKGFDVTPIVGTGISNHQLKSRLETESKELLENELNSLYFHSFGSLDLSKKLNKDLYFGVHLPLKWITYKLKNKVSNNDTYSDRSLYFLPSVWMNYEINNNNQLSFNYSKNVTYSSLENNIQKRILYNYRSTYLGNGELNRMEINTLYVHWAHSSVINQRFASLTGLVSFEKSNFLYNSQIDSLGTIVYDVISNPNNKIQYDLIGSYSKKLYSLKTLAKLNLHIGHSVSEAIINGIQDKINTTSFMGRVTLESDVLRKSELSTIFEFSTSRNDFSNAAVSTSRDFSIILNYDKLIGELTYLGTRMRYYNTITTSGRASNVFGDVTLSHRLNQSGIKLELKMTNIFNAKKYIFNQQEDTIQRFDTYDLRPRQVVVSFYSRL